jgi:LmbE family N-acetylglucosaminyl deacetylase
MEWIFLSPHLDDVALSCGGLLWEQAESENASAVWTICAGDPPPGPLSPFAESLHQRWGVGRDAIRARRSEDLISCSRLGADCHHFPIPDCIYRCSAIDGQALYASEEAIFGSLHPDESSLVGEIADLLAQKLHECGKTDTVRLVCPLALGGHVDHRLARAAADLLGQPLWYYADYPYVIEKAADIPSLLPWGYHLYIYHLSSAGLEAWMAAVAAHRSQISTFWADMTAMEAAIWAYARNNGGVRLWGPPEVDG